MADPIQGWWDAFEKIREQKLSDVQESKVTHVNQLTAEIYRLDAAVRTLARLGYTHEGGQEWKPPLGKSQNWTLNEADFETANAHAAILAAQERKRLNPYFVEMLMGWPEGWTLPTVRPDSGRAETVLWQRKLQLLLSNYFQDRNF